MKNEPRTLQQAIKFFANPDNCLEYLVERRWPNGVICPLCGSENVSYIESRRVWQCKTRHAKSQFSIKVGTIFEDSAISLDKWLTAMWMIANCKNGVSSWEIHRAIGITQKSAWFMLHRIRLAMQSGFSGKFGGPGTEVEVDETYVGGKGENMHAKKKARVIKQGSNHGKTVVHGILERSGRVRAEVIGRARPEVMRQTVRENIAEGTTVFTDAAPAYRHLVDEGFNHAYVDHTFQYVNGRVHTNGIENFWSLLKRGIGGTYVSVEPFHLFRYVDEQVFRFNNRIGMDDGDRFDLAVRQIVGKRLTYAEVTGKVGATPN